MEQGKGNKSGLFYSLKQRFWSNSVTSKSCFKSKGPKQLRSGSSHCTLISKSDNCAHSHNDLIKRAALRNVNSTSEPAIANCVVPLNEIRTSKDSMSSKDDVRRNDTIDFTDKNIASNSSTICTSNSTSTTPSRSATSEIDNLGESVLNYDIPMGINGSKSDDLTSSLKTSLMCELVKLSKYGWYWGAMSKEEAEEKLSDQPDGAFLLRDSSADHFILSLSFRSYGKTLHTRIEYSMGLFSFYQESEDSFASIAELIEHSMSYSKSAVYCYSSPRSPGHPVFPVRLTKPVSRFTHVRSLQHLCRFVIRESIRLDNIQKLPLPNKIKGYIEEGHL